VDIDKNEKTRTPLIGQLALKNHLISREELQKALSCCADSNNKNAALKDYFLSKGLVSSRNVERLAKAAQTLEFRQKEFKFGDIAVRKGFINKSVLTLALEEQGNEIKNRSGLNYIGEILVDAGFLTEKQRDYILKLQKRVRKERAKESKEKDQMVGETIGEQVSDKPDKTLSEHGLDKDLLLEPETITGGIELQVSKDFMMAFFTKTDSFDENISVGKIKGALFDKGIVSGVVLDKMIKGFIRSGGFKTKPFKVAQGIPPIHGEDARVEFFFNTDYLKAGGLTEDGVIDFKDRGEVPHVEKGTMLAEKIPMKVSRQGHNIYGDQIDTVPAKDFFIKYGTGVKVSEDGFKLLASVSGFPKFSLSGRTSVYEEYVTQGDVDYETGHIDYDGNVNVKGQVKSGLKVKGNDIKIIELDGGIVTAEGNVRIAGGINEGKIYSKGNVYAKFIRNAKVACMGDVIITKEIVDSDIECSGRCIMENGKIMTSQITSKLGVKARNIGTEKAEPCTIKVGHDVFTKKELKTIKDKVDILEKQLEQYGAKEEEKIKSLEKIRDDFLAERANLIQWANDNPGQSIVIVEGVIMSGTVIVGLNSKKRITEMICHVKVEETLCTFDGEKNLNVYKMKVKNI
jgi:uncharacterized protein (DUF342 family)